MELFHILNDQFVILRNKGVFKQGKVFRRGTKLYTNYGSGFISLMRSGGTSVPNISWLEHSIPPADLKKDSLHLELKRVEVS